jgi:hypothetical protein
VGIASNLYIAFGNMAILTVLILLIHERWKFSTISFCSVL